MRHNITQFDDFDRDRGLSLPLQFLNMCLIALVVIVLEMVAVYPVLFR